MAVVLGQAVQQGSAVVITPPEGGFGGIEAVRLSNYTSDALILTNIDTDRPGQEYLLPFQQNVYRQKNVRQAPQIEAVILGNDFQTSSVLVEWSTEPLADFPGTYPVELTPALTSGVAAPAWENHGLHVLDDGTTYSIPAEPRRVSLTIINHGPAPVQLSHADNSWPHPHKVMAVGEGRTIDTTAVVYFRVQPGDGDVWVEWMETRYGNASILSD